MKDLTMAFLGSLEFNAACYEGSIAGWKTCKGDWSASKVNIKCGNRAYH
jgi:hypothetical protein